MAENFIGHHQEHHREEEKNPVVILLGKIPPTILPFYEHGLLQKFKFLKPSDSPNRPLHQFLMTNAQEVKATVSLDHPPLPIDCKLLNCLPSLKCVVTNSVGVDHIDVAECTRRGIAVCNAGSVYSEDVADYAVGLLLDVLRRISAANKFVRSGFWTSKETYPLAHKVGRKRVGIVGLGSIGFEVAKRLEAFGCIISYNSRKIRSNVTFPYYSDIYSLALNNDVLILCCALTDETCHIVNKDVLSALGKKGIVINVGRGGLIDEKELVRSLVQGEIGGAGLDVFENEPCVPKELFEADNIVLSPHCAVITHESLSDSNKLVTGNLEAFFSNKPLLSCINHE